MSSSAEQACGEALVDDGVVVIHKNDTWIQANKQYFLPPVCNKLMHSKGQLKLFYVGGPNVRKDYHIEEGEELFYMVQGDMNLKVIEQGQFKDIPIKQGEVFLLPGKIPHSPQRKANTVGMVIERERLRGSGETAEELDGLRYHVEDSMESLYEEWVYVEDLGTQLAPIIKRFFNSEQCATGKPIPGFCPHTPPIEVDSITKLERPFDLGAWINSHQMELSKNHLPLFEGHHQFLIYCVGPAGFIKDRQENINEIWIWQVRGESLLTMDPCEDSQTQNEKDTHVLGENHSALVKVGHRFRLLPRGGNSYALVIWQDAARK